MKILKKILADHPLVKTDEKIYLNLIMLLAPVLNFICGISIDLYAPSLPGIASYFHTSPEIVKNTITISMLGFAVGCIFCGVLFDAFGRKKIIISSLFLFIVMSLFAPFCHTIYQLMLIRFFQGLLTAAMSIGSRALVADHFSGERFIAAIVYVSVAYGLGPVIAPFIGGYLQYHFGWQANFYAYAIFGVAVFVPIVLFTHERFKKLNDHTVLKIFTFYKNVITHKTFLSGVSILGLLVAIQMIYPSIGSFIVQHDLGYSSITYGNSALLVGLSYLTGTLTNRFMIRYFSQSRLLNTGFGISALALIIQLLCALSAGLTLWTLIIPIALLNFGLGFVFPNISSYCLKLFPDNVGIASAAQSFFFIIIGALGVLIMSHFKVTHLYELFFMFSSLAVLQFCCYLTFRKLQKTESGSM